MTKPTLTESALIRVDFNTEWVGIDQIKKSPFFPKIFGEKKIAKELGVSLFPEDCTEWLLVFAKGDLIGFSGYVKFEKSLHLKRAYVFEAYRKGGVYDMMLDSRIEKAKELNVDFIQATATNDSKASFEKRGFKNIKQYSKYQTYRLYLKDLKV